MKAVLQFIAYVFVIFLILSGLIDLFQVKDLDIPVCEDSYMVINASNDRFHQRDWEMVDYSHSFCASYESVESLSLSAGEKRNEIIVNLDSYEDLWGKIYKELVAESKSGIDFLADSLADISREKELSRSELAELVVTFVQDIPYSYVRVKDCSESNNKGKPCIGHIAYGLLSPYEFLHSLYGDCDTRAVLIYSLLENLGFDPMIVVSNEYAHAMVALNIPATGDHLIHRGKNYYFWETTGKGWPIGMLPPNSNNVKYWKIALVNGR
ncbi:hypothetical protein [Ekhidna sp. To15]|uniref:hypothetical protein n=1 Tax=Ekhidna sp. To15 TaxID=3395267 RepID=UPI003F51BBFA